MYFASKKVYVARNSEVEQVNNEILERNNFSDSDSDDFMDDDLMDQVEAQPEQSSSFLSSISSAFSSFSSAPQRDNRARRRSISPRERKRKRIRKPAPRSVKSANTNVVSVELKCIGNQGELMTGDPTHCENCGACFSSLSVVIEKEGDQIWSCEYCEVENVVYVEPEEIPKTATVDYIIKPADSKAEVEEETIIFVVDISGSMCVTTEIEGSHAFKKSKKDAEAFGNLDIGNQYLPGQRRNVSYVSRLQCVQTAIESQIEALCSDQPNAKVGLVCFSNEVTIVGDGKQTPVTVAGDRLYNKDKLIEIGNSFQIESSIGDSKDLFLEKMYDLTEGGATALGPAALVAIGMAQQASMAKVVIATDGLANIGIGTMEGMESDDQLEEVSKFYTEVAQYAQSQGVTISVISIAGEQVNMEQLGKLADQTQGDVNIVNPAKLTDEFSDILSSKLIASHVEATFYLHQGLSFSDISSEDSHNIANNCVTRVVGNAYEETELTFEFIVKENSADKVLSVSSLPFQVMIKYTLPSGLEGMRVITQSKDLTDDREEAEQDIDLGIMGMHNNWRSAKLAEEGNYDLVFENNLAVQNLMQRNIHDEMDNFTFNNYSADALTLNTHTRQEARAPQSSINRRQDDTSNTIFQFKNRKRNAKAYKKKR